MGLKEILTKPLVPPKPEQKQAKPQGKTQNSEQPPPGFGEGFRMAMHDKGGPLGYELGSQVMDAFTKPLSAPQTESSQPESRPRSNGPSLTGRLLRSTGKLIGNTAKTVYESRRVKSNASQSVEPRIQVETRSLASPARSIVKPNQEDVVEGVFRDATD